MSLHNDIMITVIRHWSSFTADHASCSMSLPKLLWSDWPIGLSICISNTLKTQTCVLNFHVLPECICRILTRMDSAESAVGSLSTFFRDCSQMSCKQYSWNNLESQRAHRWADFYWYLYSLTTPCYFPELVSNTFFQQNICRVAELGMLMITMTLLEFWSTNSVKEHVSHHKWIIGLLKITELIHSSCIRPSRYFVLANVPSRDNKISSEISCFA